MVMVKAGFIGAIGVLLVLASGPKLQGGGIDSNSAVFIILMENHNWSSIKGSASAPYINNTLLPIASYTDQYYNPPGIHPSEPNYLWLEAGTNFGITNDKLPSTNHQSTTNHLVTLLKNAGISWRTYQENITGTNCPTANAYPYAPKHNPFVFFDDVVNAGCTTVMRPFTELANDLANHAVAQYNFITPNLVNDMHDSAAPLNNPVAQGDTWLQNNLPMILQSDAYLNNGLVLITWDEAASGDGPIGMIVLSPLAKGVGYRNTIHYTHSSTLRTLQKIFGVTPLLGGAATAQDLSDLFVLNAIPGADSQIIIEEVAQTSTNFTITWQSQPGLIYRVQWTNNLTDAWQSITPDITGDGNLESWTDDGMKTGGFSSAQRFYRVILP
ncbi:MAG: phosphatidylinositol-3-phosphatase [Verrucomicrobiota bacterium]